MPWLRYLQIWGQVRMKWTLTSFFHLEWGCYWLFWLETPLEVWPTSWLSLPLAFRCERNSVHKLIVCHKFWADYNTLIYTHCEVWSWWCQWGVSHCCSWWRVTIWYFVCDTSKLQQHSFFLCLSWFGWNWHNIFSLHVFVEFSLLPHWYFSKWVNCFIVVGVQTLTVGWVISIFVSYSYLACGSYVKSRAGANWEKADGWNWPNYWEIKESM
jgi:hypothetical protein